MNQADHKTRADGNAKHAARLRERAADSTDETYQRRATCTAAFLDRIAAAHARRS